MSIDGFTGEVVRPGDGGYEEARTAYMVVGSPAVVLRPRTVDDVVAAVRYAKDNSLVLSVRSGGHSGSGYGTNDGGAVIDLSLMRSVEVVDPDSRTVRIESGATWGEVARHLQDHGLALTSGDTLSVGVGGLTQGGGIGWLVRKYGLTIDLVSAVEVVTADGRVLRADGNQNQDLFWAIRGGGGNFGVVTSFEFTAFELSRVYAGSITYPVEETAAVVRAWRDYMRTAPEELNSSITVMPSFGPEFPAAVLVLVCYGGSDEAAALAAIKPLRQLGTVVADDVQEKDYVDVLEEAHPPPGIKVVVRSLFAREFSDGLIELIAGSAGRPDSPVMQVRSLAGAINRVPADATAFAHRDSEIMMFVGRFLPLDAPPEATQQAIDGWKPFAEHGSGAYLNFMNEMGEDEIRAVYPGQTYERLAAVKAAYDPGNLFSQNANIPPA
jgi:FAD/FMN-containing dehydrogenase